jgi:hypothetical protein
MIQMTEQDFDRLLRLQERAAAPPKHFPKEVATELAAITTSIRALMRYRAVPEPLVAVDPATVPTQEEIDAMVLAGRNR